MFHNVFLKSLRDQRRALLGWSASLAVLVIVMGAIFPLMRDMADLDKLMASYPEAFKELFNIEAMTTGVGFMNAELFSALLPALFIVLGIGRGARLVAGEEEAGTLETLLVTPLSPVRLLLQQAAVLAVTVIALGAVLFVSMSAASALFDMDIGVAEAATGALSMTLLGIEYGWLALAVGAVTGRRTVAVAVATVMAFAGYVLYVAGEFVDALEPWRPISPFHQALEGGPLGAGLPVSYVWMVIVPVVLLAAALPVFDRRDIATA
ncbi:ABC transporter permease subunit [Planobispora siamensis]|uniref:ABC-2 type transport system permease protein n=1 Tax=Planobispora siamensis TaxID=936338 RepID=A0A8J3WQG8_9ACTN|nr:ABC transporter permease subunit [Planobispora siamensis]GIH95776.1 hypothetical protein Psi01_64060 [Planobispora siamensis]